MTQDEYMQEQGMESGSVAKNLGIIAVSVCLILLVVLFYFLITLCNRRFKLCQKLQVIIKKKMFYSGPMRYVIVSYLKLANQFATMFLLALLVDKDTVMSFGYGVALLVLIVWPLWTEYWLLTNFNKIDEPLFSEKFNTLYQGIRKDSFTAMCYNSVFAVRRFDLILMNIAFTQGSPLTGVDRSFYLFKIYCFMVTEIAYLSYIHLVRPHNENIFNSLELINEYCLLGLAYTMLNYTHLSSVPSNPTFDSLIEWIAIGLIILMTVINFGAMIHLSIKKLCLALKKRKAKKLAKKMEEERIAKQLETKRPRAKQQTLEAIPEEKYGEAVADLSEIKVDKPKVRMNRFNRAKVTQWGQGRRKLNNLFHSEQDSL